MKHWKTGVFFVFITALICGFSWNNQLVLQKIAEKETVIQGLCEQIETANREKAKAQEDAKAIFGIFLQVLAENKQRKEESQILHGELKFQCIKVAIFEDALRELFRGITVPNKNPTIQYGRQLLPRWTPVILLNSTFLEGKKAKNKKGYYYSRNIEEHGEFGYVLCSLGNNWFSVFCLEGPNAGQAVEFSPAEANIEQGVLVYRVENQGEK